MTHMDFAGSYAQADRERESERRDRGGAREADRRHRVQCANLMFRLPMTFVEIFPVGVVVPLVLAGLLRNSRFLPARRG